MKKQLFLGAAPEIFENAKKNRYNMTAAESLFWANVTTYFNNLRFRRQHPLDNYIADFYCHKHKLVIEIDGSIHLLPKILQKDIEKQTYLEQQGLKVLRFTNN